MIFFIKKEILISDGDSVYIYIYICICVYVDINKREMDKMRDSVGWPSSDINYKSSKVMFIAERTRKRITVG